MAEIRYSPGTDRGWMVVVGADRLVATGRAVAAGLVDSLWAAVDSRAEIGVVLDLLTRGGITSAPAFVVLDLGSGSMLVRGDATVSTPAGESFSGAGATTWVERTVDTASLRIELGGGSDALLPIRSGVVVASSIEVGDAPAAALATPPAEADPLTPPAAEPVRPVVAEAAPAVVAEPEPPVAAQPASPAAVVPPPPHPPVAVSEATIIPTGTISVPQFETIAQPAADGADPAAPDGAYDFLFGRTVRRSVEDAAVRAPDEDDAAQPAVGDLTVRSSDIAALREKRRADRAAGVATEIHGFELVTPSGVESLDQPILIGRAPSATRVSGDRMPRLLTVANDDISRNHVQIELEGEAVVVTDLHSSNGTMIVLPGKAPQRIRSGEPTTVIADTVVDLGSGVVFTVRSRA